MKLKNIVDFLFRREHEDKKQSNFKLSLSLRWACFSNEMWYKYRRKFFCSRGQHKLEHIYSEFSSPTHKIKTGIDYQKCWVCNSLFFDSEKEKEVYLLIRKHNLIGLKNLLTGGVR